MLDASAAFMTEERAALFPRIAGSTGLPYMAEVTFDLAIDIRSRLEEGAEEGAEETKDGGENDDAELADRLLMFVEGAGRTSSKGVRVTKHQNFSKTVHKEIVDDDGTSRIEDRGAFFFQAELSFYDMTTANQAKLRTILGDE